MTKRRQIKRVTRKGVRFGSRGRRIRVPPSPDRQIFMRGKDSVRWDAINLDPEWYTGHKRGPARPRVGIDPLEFRAVSRDVVVGFQSERIVYKWLIGAKLRPGVDFDFQTSMLGGRLTLGGMVVDFIFFRLMIALRIQGPTHGHTLQMRKDLEQRQILEEMGFKVYDLDLPTIWNEQEFNQFMRNMLFMERSGGKAGMRRMETQQHTDQPWYWGEISRHLADIEARLRQWQ